jgi:hypothetical protein
MLLLGDFLNGGFAALFCGRHFDFHFHGARDLIVACDRDCEGHDLILYGAV